MEASGLEHVDGKGLILKLMIPEDSFLPITRLNDGTPGIMLSVLIARAIEVPDDTEYIAWSRLIEFADNTTGR